MPRSVSLFLSLMRVIILPKTRIMTTVDELPAVRVRTENPNHHLWNNHGTWFLHYTVHPTAFTKERIRRSLGTKDIEIARTRRDAFFTNLMVSASKLSPAGTSKEAAA